MRWLTDRPYLISILILIAVIVWMMMPKREAEDAGATQTSARPVQKVQVRQMTADATELSLDFTGRTRPLQEAQIAAEVGGQIMTIGAERGSRVEAGDIIASLDQGTLTEQLASAQADYNVARADYAAKTKIEQGDFVDKGHTIADLLNIDTLVVEGNVPETLISNLRVGIEATVSLIGGETRAGTVRYISPVADQRTRMFSVEIEVDNSDGAMPAGMTAEVSVPLGAVSAYKLSPALLWLSGIPDDARVITLGQGFVHEGDTVEPIDESEPAVNSDN